MAHSGSTEQAAITDFNQANRRTTDTSDGSDGEHPDDTADPTSEPTDDPLAAVDLPDQQEWDDSPTDCACGRDACTATFVPSTDTFAFDGGFLRAAEAGVLTSDVEAFIDTHADRELDVPAYYSRFDDQFTPYVGYVSGTSGAYAFGITASRLEGAVRLASGGGAFRSDDLTVYGLGKMGALACYDGRAVLVSSVKVGKPDGFDAPTNEVCGVAVEEQDDAVLAGIEAFVPLVERETDLSIVGYDRLDGGAHYFRTDDGGETLKVQSRALKRLRKATADEQEIVGEYEYEDPWGETFSFSIAAEDLEYEVGEQRTVGGKVVGMRPVWKDPRRSSRANLSGRVCLRVAYLTLSVSELSSGAYRVRLKETTRTVAKRRPEGRSYSPTRDVGPSPR